MKNFLKWFKNSTKIKRWIFLLLISMGLTCYGFTQVLVLERLGIKELLSIIITFVIGFTCFVIGIIYIQRRSIQIAIENNCTKGSDIDIKGLINNKNVYEKGPNIVLIGGGKGLSTVLKGIKNFTSNITAITTFSSYKENKDIQLKQINKIKDNFMAMCSNPNEFEKIMQNKIDRKKEDIENTFWQQYFVNIKETFGDYQNGILQTNKVFSLLGEIIPVTLDEMRVCVELKDGTVIENETQLSEVLSDRATKINRTYIRPSNCKVTPGILDKIKEADVIVFGPGSLYTEIIPNLLIKNVTKTIKESKALKIYISNITNENRTNK